MGEECIRGESVGHLDAWGDGGIGDSAGHVQVQGRDGFENVANMWWGVAREDEDTKDEDGRQGGDERAVDTNLIGEGKVGNEGGRGSRRA